MSGRGRGVSNQPAWMTRGEGPGGEPFPPGVPGGPPSGGGGGGPRGSRSRSRSRDRGPPGGGGGRSRSRERDGNGGGGRPGIDGERRDSFGRLRGEGGRGGSRGRSPDSGRRSRDRDRGGDFGPYGPGGGGGGGPYGPGDRGRGPPPDRYGRGPGPRDDFGSYGPRDDPRDRGGRDRGRGRRGRSPPRGGGNRSGIRFRSLDEEIAWVEERRRKRRERRSLFDVEPTPEELAAQRAQEAALAAAGGPSTISGPVGPGTYGPGGSSGGADGGKPRLPVQSQPQQTRHARRLYIGHLPPDVDEGDVHSFFRSSIHTAMGIDPNDSSRRSAADDPILSVYINKERRFAFLEFRTMEMTTACLQLDGIDIMGKGKVKVKRPNDYNPALAPESNPRALPNFDVSKLGIVSGTVPDGPNKIFIGGLPYHLTEDQVLELLRAFGTVRAFHLVKSDPAAVTSKGYCFVEYADDGVTQVAVMGLNGMDMGGGKTISARMAASREGGDAVAAAAMGSPGMAVAMAAAGGGAATGGVGSGAPPVMTYVDGVNIESLLDQAMAGSTGIFPPEGITTAPVAAAPMAAAAANPMASVMAAPVAAAAAPALDVHAVANAALAAAGAAAATPAQPMMMGQPQQQQQQPMMQAQPMMQTQQQQPMMHMQQQQPMQGQAMMGQPMMQQPQAQQQPMQGQAMMQQQGQQQPPLASPQQQQQQMPQSQSAPNGAVGGGAAPGGKTRVLVLLNMVTDDDLRNEEEYGALVDEVREECEKFGRLAGMKIPRDGDGYPPSAIKKIFLEYASLEDAARAETELAGRQFGPNVVGATYFDEGEYAANRLH